MSKNGEYVLDIESYDAYRRKYDTNGTQIGITTVASGGGSSRPKTYGSISDNGSVIVLARDGGQSISFNGNSMGSSFFSNDYVSYRSMGVSGSGNCFITYNKSTNTVYFYSIVQATSSITLVESITVFNCQDINDHPIPISYNGLIYALKQYNNVESWKVYKRTSVTTTTSHTLIGDFTSSFFTLSSDGTHIAVDEPTATQYKKVISVYKYDGSGTSWTKIGSSINTNTSSSSSTTTYATGYIDDSLTTLYIADEYPLGSKTLKKYDFE
jgi:hypothetical protein